MNEEKCMSPSRLPATLIAITLSAILTEPIGSGRAYAAVLCKSRTGAVVVRGTCKKKESQGDAITVNHKHATETLPGTLDRNVYPEPARRVQLIGERDDSTPNYYKAKIECEV